MLTGLFKNSRDRSEFLYLTKCLTLCEHCQDVHYRRVIVRVTVWVTIFPPSSGTVRV